MRTQTNKIKRALLILGVLLVFQSCGLFKNSTKHKETHKLEVKTSEQITLKDSLQSTSVKTKNTVDSGTTTTERKIEKEETVKGTTTVVKGKVNKGTETTLTDSLGNIVVLMLDSLANKIEVKIKTPDRIVKTTTTEKIVEQAAKKTNEKDSTSTNVQKQVAITRDEDLAQINSISTKTSKTNVWAVIGAILAAGIVVIGVLWYLIRQLKYK